MYSIADLVDDEREPHGGKQEGKAITEKWEKAKNWDNSQSRLKVSVSLEVPSSGWPPCLPTYTPHRHPDHFRQIDSPQKSLSGGLIVIEPRTSSAAQQKNPSLKSR